MEKGNAADPAAVLAAVPAVQGAGERVTSAVVSVTADTAESVRGKLIDTAATAAVDEVRERIRRDDPADDTGTGSPPRPGDSV